MAEIRIRKKATPACVGIVALLTIIAAVVVSGNGLVAAQSFNPDREKIYSPVDVTPIDYDLNSQAIISCYGTDLTSAGFFLTAALNGLGIAFGFEHGPQATAAIHFFQQVAEAKDRSLKPSSANAGDWRSANIELTEHSLGGGLAGFVGASTCRQVIV